MSFDFGAPAPNNDIAESYATGAPLPKVDITESYPTGAADPWSAFDAIKPNANAGLDCVDFLNRGASAKAELFGDLIECPAIEAPLREPAEEPAPASSPSQEQRTLKTNTLDDAGLQDLYKQAFQPLEPAHRQQSASQRFDAFSAFDSIAQIASGPQPQSGHQMPQQIVLPSAATTAPPLLGAFTQTQAAVCPQQLEQLDQQELLRMQAMVAQALQARTHEQQQQSSCQPLADPSTSCPFGAPQQMLQAEASESTAVAVKADFDDLFAAFQEKNLLGGM